MGSLWRLPTGQMSSTRRCCDPDDSIGRLLWACRDMGREQIFMHMRKVPLTIALRPA